MSRLSRNYLIIFFFWSTGTCVNCFAVDCYEEIAPYYYDYNQCYECNVPNNIHINTPDDVNTYRNNIIDYLWNDGWPTTKMPVIKTAADCNSIISPDTLGRLVLWLDASDANTITLQETDKVRLWEDKSSYNNDFYQSTSSKMPQYKTDIVNNKPTVYFDGVDDFIDANDADSLDVQKTTIFMVTEVTSYKVKYPCPLTKLPVNQSYLFVTDKSAGHPPLFRVHSGSRWYDAQVASVPTSFNVWTGVSDGNSVEFYLNSRWEASTETSGTISATTGKLRLGDASDGGNAYNGHIAEVLIYDSALSDADRDAVLDYLLCKYDIPWSYGEENSAWIENIDSNNIGDYYKIDVEMDYQMHSYGYFIKAANSVNRLVIFQHGHDGEALGFGTDVTLKYYLDNGFDVAVFWMPLYRENSRTAYGVPGYGDYTFTTNWPAHNDMSDKLENADGSFIRFFVEPVIVSLNYFETNYNYNDIIMTGYSGGGWTTHICAAIDSRIRLSFPTAGSLPLYLRSGPCPNGSGGDAEQTWPALYENTASWLDIYILGGYGNGRGQIHILNQYDNCCFYGINYQTYEPYVSQRLETLGAGYYNVFLDSTHSLHQISQYAIDNAMHPKVITADIDSSGSVTFEDFAILASQWHNICAIPTADLASPPDNFINFKDLAIFAVQWLNVYITE